MLISSGAVGVVLKRRLCWFRVEIQCIKTSRFHFPSRRWKGVTFAQPQFKSHGKRKPLPIPCHSGTYSFVITKQLAQDLDGRWARLRCTRPALTVCLEIISREALAFFDLAIQPFHCNSNPMTGSCDFENLAWLLWSCQPPRSVAKRDCNSARAASVEIFPLQNGAETSSQRSILHLHYLDETLNSIYPK